MKATISYFFGGTSYLTQFQIDVLLLQMTRVGFQVYSLKNNKILSKSLKSFISQNFIAPRKVRYVNDALSFVIVILFFLLLDF